MRVDEEELRRLYQAATSRAARPGGPGCPRAEALVEAAARSPDRTVDAGLLDHLAGCADCAQEFQSLREVAAWAERAAGSTLRPAPARRRTGGGLWASLAAAAAVFVLVPFLRESDGPGSQYRAPEVEAIQALVSEERPQPRDAVVLRWRPVPGARYTVTVAGEDLTVLHTANSFTSAEYRVPPASLAGIPPGRRVLWRVEASLPGGKHLTSGVFLLQLE